MIAHEPCPRVVLVASGREGHTSRPHVTRSLLVFTLEMIMTDQTSPITRLTRVCPFPAATGSAEMSQLVRPQMCVWGSILTWAGFLERWVLRCGIVDGASPKDSPSGLRINIFAFLLFKSWSKTVASVTTCPSCLCLNCLLSPEHGPSGTRVCWPMKADPGEQPINRLYENTGSSMGVLTTVHPACGCA